MMNLNLTFDETNVAQMTVFASLMTECSKYGIRFAIGNSIVEDTVKTVELKKTKTYAEATDVACQWVLDGTKVSYALADGKYVGQTSVRKTLNSRLRNAGATYDKDKKVWVFSTKAKAQKFVEDDVVVHYNTLEGIDYDYPTIVTADEINAIRDKAQARTEKKAQKNAQ